MPAHSAECSHPRAASSEVSGDGVTAGQQEPEGARQAGQATAYDDAEGEGERSGNEPASEAPCDPAKKPATTLSLTDLPAAWLQHLPDELELESLLPVFRTCSFFRDLLLATCSMHMRFELPIPAGEVAAAQRSLVRACKHHSRLNLEFGPAPAPGEDGAQEPTPPTAAEVDASAWSLLTGAKDELAYIVESVVIEDLHLSALVPPWITDLFKNMINLQLHTCHFPHLPDPTTPLPPSPQLRHLHLSSPPTVLDEPTRMRWQHQLASLNRLRSLSLQWTPEQLTTTPESATIFLLCCSAVGTQLTKLSLRFPMIQECPPDMDPVRVDLLFLLPDGISWFTHVQELSIWGHIWVHDAGVEVLLGMTSLKHLHCYGFKVRDSYADRPCSWTQLSLTELDVESFANLPLANVQSIQVMAADRVFVHFCTDLEVTTRAVAAISRCGGLQWGGISPDLSLANPYTAGYPCMAAVLPLFTMCEAWCLRLLNLGPVTGEMLAAIKQHIPSTQLETIRFDCCSWAPDVWPVLLPGLLPQVTSVRLWNDGRFDTSTNVTEAQLVEVCAHASHPVRLEVKDVGGLLLEGWEGRVQAAMAAAGHQHVTLVNLHEETDQAAIDEA